jgi:hypothetical protein
MKCLWHKRRSKKKKFSFLETMRWDDWKKNNEGKGLQKFFPTSKKKLNYILFVFFFNLLVRLNKNMFWILILMVYIGIKLDCISLWSLVMHKIYMYWKAIFHFLKNFSRLCEIFKFSRRTMRLHNMKLSFFFHSSG